MSPEMILLMVIGIYLAVGIVVLAIFDLLTGRVRSRLIPASDETRSKLAGTGYWTGHRGAIVITLLAVWAFWPVAIYGYIEKRLRRRDDAD